MSEDLKPLAVVTGASSGIGYELAKLCAENGFDLVIAADRPEIVEAASAFTGMGAKVEHLQTDLSTKEGVDALYEHIGGRPVDYLLANAGQGLGHAFLDQNFDDIMGVVNTNITGTIYLIHRIG